MEIIDIHTHHLYENPSESILNCYPSQFNPIPGRYYSVGFHPWYLSDNYNENWITFKKQVVLPQVLAVGETGLDKMAQVDFAIQKNAFIKHAEIASDIGKPLVIHCVKAYNEIIRYKIDMKPDVPWIIHGFRGKKELAQELIYHGFNLSFGEKYQQDALLLTPTENVFIETDESAVNIKQLYYKASSLLGMSGEAFTKQIKQNVRKVFFRL